MLMLGEVGCTDEYDIIEAVKSGRSTKPMIAWCVGAAASCFNTAVQFGHAGAQARDDMETAAAKNKAMQEAGIIVPDAFEKLPETIRSVYEKVGARRPSKSGLRDVLLITSAKRNTSPIWMVFGRQPSRRQIELFQEACQTSPER